MRHRHSQSTNGTSISVPAFRLMLKGIQMQKHNNPPSLFTLNAIYALRPTPPGTSPNSKLGLRLGSQQLLPNPPHLKFLDLPTPSDG